MAGNYTSGAQAAYRKVNQNKPEFRLKQGVQHGASSTEPRGAGEKAADASSDKAAHVFGKASRPSTPIEFLMTNSYQRSFVEDQKEKFDTDSKKQGGVAKLKVRTTKATGLRNTVVKEALSYQEAESAWKMPKFANIPAKVETR